MPPKRGSRRRQPSLEESITVQSSPDPVTPSLDDSQSQYPLLSLESLPSRLLPSSSSTTPNAESVEPDRFIWSIEMTTALIEFIYNSFKDGKLSDNGMKKELWLQCSNEVNKVSNGKYMPWEKCKNKWNSDIKEKWKHWTILSEQSGFGWNEELERFEANDYVWTSLNKTYPRISWHKTHVMFHRDLLSEILHESQATGKGAVSGNEPEREPIGEHFIDPRLLDYDQSDTARSLAKASPAPQPRPKTTYNRSKKRLKEGNSDDEDGELSGIQKKGPRKVDIGTAVEALSRQWELSREERLSYKTVSQQAVHLLEVKYGERMELMEFIQGCTFFKDEGNAGIFLAITSAEKRDRWLEIALNIELKSL
jgi:hypothetical protein